VTRLIHLISLSTIAVLVFAAIGVAQSVPEQSSLGQYSSVDQAPVQGPSEQSAAPTENAVPAENTAPATEPGITTLPTVTIINSSGEMVPVQVEIADTAAEWQTGLMERTALAQDAGMLFVYDQEQLLSFWMKDTLIPLSIAFIDSQGRIVDIQDMQPLDETSHQSAAPAQYALEVNQGFFGERGIMVGDTVELPE
jgi:uncharacterized membrane protein (UPF0127 family)